MLTKSFFTIVISTLIISCSHGYRSYHDHHGYHDHHIQLDYKPRAIHQLVENEAALAIAAEAKTGQPFVVDSISGKKQSACTKPNVENNDQGYSNMAYQRREKTSDCEAKIVNPNGKLIKAIEMTQSPIMGTINIDGKETPVQFHVTLISSYEGSYCTTTFVAGSEYQKCVTQQEECDGLRNIDYPPPTYALNDFLRAFSKCQNLITN